MLLGLESAWRLCYQCTTHCLKSSLFAALECAVPGEGKEVVVTRWSQWEPNRLPPSSLVSDYTPGQSLMERFWLANPKAGLPRDSGQPVRKCAMRYWATGAVYVVLAPSQLWQPRLLCYPLCGYRLCLWLLPQLAHSFRWSAENT
jgi:hypothetical protein